MNRSAEWSAAQVIEPLGFVDDNMNTVGALVLRAETPSILSLDPGSDFELNTDIIHQWKVIFQASDGSVLGDADHSSLLREITPFVLDQQNGSILIRALADDELHDLYVQTIFE